MSGLMSAGHVEATCRRCQGPNVSWTAPSPLWNLVMRGGAIDGVDRFDGIVCPTCFVVVAEDARLASRWYVSADRVALPLQTVLPDGRVWVEAARLWLPPEPPPWQLVAPHRAPQRVVTQLAADAAGWQQLPGPGPEADRVRYLVEVAASRIWAQAFHAGMTYQLAQGPAAPIRVDLAAAPDVIRNGSAEEAPGCGPSVIG